MTSIENQKAASQTWKFYAPEYNSVFLTALLIQVFFLVLSALLLDGGRMLRCVQVAVLSHWAATAIILFRRPKNPTQADLMIVKYAFLGMIVLVAAFGWPMVQLLGLER